MGARGGGGTKRVRASVERMPHSHKFAFRLRDFCASESTRKALNRVHYIFIDIQRRPRPHPVSRIHARRISKLAASPQKQISRRIIAEDRFPPHKRPNSTFARFRGIFRNPSYRHSLELQEPSSPHCQTTEKGTFRSRRDRMSIRGIGYARN